MCNTSSYSVRHNYRLKFGYAETYRFYGFSYVFLLEVAGDDGLTILQGYAYLGYAFYGCNGFLGVGSAVIAIHTLNCVIDS